MFLYVFEGEGTASMLGKVIIMALFSHRIIWCLGLEGTLKISFQPPCCGQRHLLLDQGAQSPVQPCLGSVLLPVAKFCSLFMLFQPWMLLRGRDQGFGNRNISGVPPLIFHFLVFLLITSQLLEGEKQQGSLGGMVTMDKCR